MMLPVLLRVNLAQQTLIHTIKIGPCPVTNAPPERHRLQEVSNATEPHAKLALLSIQEHVQNAHKVGNRKSWMLRHARDAQLVLPHWRMPVEVRRVLGAILVDLVVRKAFAMHARLDSIKIPKEK